MARNAVIAVERASCGSSLTARALFAGKDLCVLVCGGDAPHIGSVSVGVPRPSLTGSGTGATVSTFNLTGHKDDVIGAVFAERLATVFSCVVNVGCGIHFAVVDEGILENIVADANLLLADLESALRRFVLVECHKGGAP